METVTLSKEELKQLINEEVKKAIENAKPVRDNRMKNLELYFRNEIASKNININWYSAWTSIRSSVALRMGFNSVQKVSADKYDEFISIIRKEIDEIITVFTKEAQA